MIHFLCLLRFLTLDSNAIYLIKINYLSDKVYFEMLPVYSQYTQNR